jgi:CubicO group peptidase (beta-lactamase class C family)
VVLDWERTIALLEAEAPFWEPGTAHGEHAYFYGHLVGELARRVDGRGLGTFLREEVAEPWDLDFHVGLRAAERARVTPLTDPGGRWATEDHGSLYRLALGNPPGLRDLSVLNGDAWRAAEIPAVNGHGTARGIARFYGGLARGGELDGVRLLGAATLAEALRPQAGGHDVLLDRDATWGLGFAVEDGGFGMGGTGGSLGWAHPDRRLGYAYVTTRLGDHDRAEHVERALLGAL